MEFGICIITQIVYAIVTFKLIMCSFSNAYIVHITMTLLHIWQETDVAKMSKCRCLL